MQMDKTELTAQVLCMQSTFLGKQSNVTIRSKAMWLSDQKQCDYQNKIILFTLSMAHINVNISLI